MGFLIINHKPKFEKKNTSPVIIFRKDMGV